MGRGRMYATLLSHLDLDDEVELGAAPPTAAATAPEAPAAELLELELGGTGLAMRLLVC